MPRGQPDHPRHGRTTDGEDLFERDFAPSIVYARYRQEFATEMQEAQKLADQLGIKLHEIDVVAAQEELDFQEKQFADAKVIFANVEKATKQVFAARDDLSEKRKERREKTKNLIEGVWPQVKDVFDRHICEVMSENTKLQEENARLREVAAASSTGSDMTERLQKLLDDKQEASETKQNADEEARRVKKLKTKPLKREIKHLKRSADEKSKEHELLEKDLKSAEDMLESEKTKCFNLETTIKSLKRDKEKLEAQILKVDQTVGKWETKHETVQKRCDNLKGDNQRLNTNIAKQKNEIRELNETVTRLKQEESNLRKDVSDSLKDYDRWASKKFEEVRVKYNDGLTQKAELRADITKLKSQVAVEIENCEIVQKILAARIESLEQSRDKYKAESQEQRLIAEATQTDMDTAEHDGKVWQVRYESMKMSSERLVAKHDMYYDLLQKRLDSVTDDYNVQHDLKEEYSRQNAVLHERLRASEVESLKQKETQANKQIRNLEAESEVDASRSAIIGLGAQLKLVQEKVDEQKNDLEGYAALRGNFDELVRDHETSTNRLQAKEDELRILLNQYNNLVRIHSRCPKRGGDGSTITDGDNQPGPSQGPNEPGSSSQPPPSRSSGPQSNPQSNAHGSRSGSGHNSAQQTGNRRDGTNTAGAAAQQPTTSGRTHSSASSNALGTSDVLPAANSSFLIDSGELDSSMTFDKFKPLGNIEPVDEPMATPTPQNASRPSNAFRTSGTTMMGGNAEVSNSPRPSSTSESAGLPGSTNASGSHGSLPTWELIKIGEAARGRRPQAKELKESGLPKDICRLIHNKDGQTKSHRKTNADYNLDRPRYCWLSLYHADKTWESPVPIPVGKSLVEEKKAAWEVIWEDVSAECPQCQHRKANGEDVVCFYFHGDDTNSIVAFR